MARQKAEENRATLVDDEREESRETGVSGRGTGKVLREVVWALGVEKECPRASWFPCTARSLWPTLPVSQSPQSKPIQHNEALIRLFFASERLR